MALFNHDRPLWALLAAAPILACVSTASYAQTWKINLRDADLAAFINEVADITGKNFAVDPRVRGNVTVISNKALNKDQVYDLFLGVLNVNGIVAIPSGNTVKLVPDANVKNAGIPYDVRKSASGDQIVTRVIWLDNTNANDLLPALRPLMPQFAHLAAVPGTNALIVSDRANNIAQLETIVRSLDGSGSQDVEVVSLKSSQAEDVLGLVDSMSSTGAAKDIKGSRVRVLADVRSNRILIKGDAHSRQRIKQLIEMLDVPAADQLGGLKVFRLKYSNAKDLSDILQGLITGQAVNTSNTSNSSSTQNSTTQNNTNTTTGGSINTPSINLNSNRNQQNQVSSFNHGQISIIADEKQNALVVRADPKFMVEIEQAIQQLDVRRQQVMIEAAIVEVIGTNADQLGVQWALGDLNSGIGLVNFTNIGSSLAGLATGLLSGNATAQAAAVSGLSGASVVVGDYKKRSDGSQSLFGALIQALEQSGKSNLLSAPSVVTMDNEEAYIVVGQNVPFISGTYSAGSAGNPYQSIDRKDVGITLKVIPHIGEGGSVRLEVEQEVSAVQENSSRIQASDLITSKRQIKTMIQAEDGQTVVLGGLIEDNQSESRQAIPGLGRIPGVGRLFRSDSASNEKRNLLVFIHPTIMTDVGSSNEATRQRYQQLRSLELSLNQDGSFARLPQQVDQVFEQRIAPQAMNYQKVKVTPTQQAQVVVQTPVAIEPRVELNVAPSAKVAVERTPNTVTKITVSP